MNTIFITDWSRDQKQTAVPTLCKCICVSDKVCFFPGVHVASSVVVSYHNLTDNHSTQHREKTTPVGFYFGFCCFVVCCHGDKASQQTFALEMWFCKYLHTGSACETLLIHQQKDFPKGTRTYIWVARTNLKLQHVNVNKASSLKRTAHQESKERQAKNWRW